MQCAVWKVASVEGAQSEVAVAGFQVAVAGIVEALPLVATLAEALGEAWSRS